jgi:hypothetical protein
VAGLRDGDVMTGMGPDTGEVWSSMRKGGDSVVAGAEMKGVAHTREGG